MKFVGMLLLIAGVGIGAATGARLVPEVESRQKAAGTASLMTGQVKRAFDAYCELRSGAGLPLGDGCKAPDGDGDGVPDGTDKCAESPETVNGFEDADGCEDVAPTGTLTVSASVEGMAYACVQCVKGDCDGGCAGSAKKLGSTPVTVEALNAGDYLVYVTSEGHKTAYQEVKVVSGETQSVNASMTRAGSSTLSVSTIPSSPGFVYLVDGKGPRKTLGPLPLVGYEHPAGTYTLQIDTKYYKDFEREITLAPDAPSTLDAQLVSYDRAEEIKAAQAALAAELKALGPTSSALPAEVAKAREEWIALKKALVEPAAIARSLGPPEVTTAGRFKEWFSLSGVPFLLSLFLVISGAILSRRVSAKEALESAPSEESQEGQPVDFGELLAEVQRDVEALKEQISALDSADEHALAAGRDAIQELQVTKVDLLVDARTRLQARYGVSGFAAVFGPLSAAERHLNRAWCCLVDRHVPAGQSAIVGAEAFFEEARAELDRLAQSG